ncbi:hypothetical protein [Krasilnikovia sp. M28-CT-15]|uniref:hypothetical protein n=1 Tax=Krasilnikovia sp. M28-CT-15 TaxID=3373540 RepID=UPI003876DEF1
MSGGTIGDTSVTLRVDYWQLVVGVVDNEISNAVTEEGTEDIVETAWRVRGAVCARASGGDGYFLPGDQRVSVALGEPDWTFVTVALSEAADRADDMTPGVDPDGTEQREVLAAIRSELARNASTGE